MPISDRLRPLKILAVGFFGSLFLRAIRASLRLKIIDPYNSLKVAEKGGLIAAFWHGQQLMMPWIYLDLLKNQHGKKSYVLSSKSLDGRFMAKVLEFLGVDSFEGSSSRGGAEALFKFNKILKEGHYAVFTPDGPTGPIYKIKPGVINLASSSQKNIIPAAFATTSCWRFNSWDRMQLPKPFSKAVILIGPALSVPRDLSDLQVEEYSIKLENLLNDCSQKVQEFIASPAQLQN